MSEITRARPLQAALASAAAFAAGAAPPVLLVVLLPLAHLNAFVVASSLLLLAVLGPWRRAWAGPRSFEEQQGSPSGERWPWVAARWSATFSVRWSERLSLP